MESSRPEELFRASWAVRKEMMVWVKDSVEKADVKERGPEKLMGTRKFLMK